MTRTLLAAHHDKLSREFSRTVWGVPTKTSLQTAQTVLYSGTTPESAARGSRHADPKDQNVTPCSRGPEHSTHALLGAVWLESAVLLVVGLVMAAWLTLVFL